MNSRETQGNRIALLGGTFDPVHLGHIALAEAACQQLQVDKVWFIPTQLRYYKKGQAAEVYDRVAMLSLALAPFSNMEISDVELRKRPEDNYTVNTLRTLTKEYPDTRFVFVIGGDSLEHLSTWRAPEEFLQLATFAAAVREDVDAKRARALIRKYEKDYPGADLVLLKMDPVDVSSTEIRESAKTGASMEGLVPEAVERYIRKNRLYM